MISHCSKLSQCCSSVLFIFFSFIFPTNSYAWNATGHMVVANIAYQNLKPAARVKVDSMVGSLKQEYPEMATFMNIAYWPDAIRSQRIESFTHWHYIDIPYSKDGTQAPSNSINTDNAVWAINNVQVVVKNDHANPYDRARFLSFLVHIVGDLHQPLHTTSLFSANHPDGDRGGNAYIVINHGQLQNLHSLWDSGVGVFAPTNKFSLDDVSKLAAEIMQQYPISFFGNRVIALNPSDWANEGGENAKKYVYSAAEGEVLPAVYVDNGKQLAEQQAALAGYRLANLLNSLLA